MRHNDVGWTLEETRRFQDAEERQGADRAQSNAAVRVEHRDGVVACRTRRDCGGCWRDRGRNTEGERIHD